VSAAFYGDAAVAAMTIVTKIFMFIFSIILGVGQGYQPAVGYNYGAKKMGRVREAFFHAENQCRGDDPLRDSGIPGRPGADQTLHSQRR